MQTEHPAYTSELKGFTRPSDAWWGEVIKRTAVGAGADPDGRLTLPMEDALF
jgi:hypothetical protein